MTEEQKQWIDNASYEDMLRRNRYGPIGDPMFQSGTELCDYFKEVFKRKRQEAGDSGHVTASKRIGWG